MYQRVREVVTGKEDGTQLDKALDDETVSDVYLTMGFLIIFFKFLLFLGPVPYPVLFPHLPIQECPSAGWMRKKSSRHWRRNKLDCRHLR